MISHQENFGQMNVDNSQNDDDHINKLSRHELWKMKKEKLTFYEMSE